MQLHDACIGRIGVHEEHQCYLAAELLRHGQTEEAEEKGKGKKRETV